MSSWQERFRNEDYKRWIKVGYGIDLLCEGIRPYVEKEIKAFHGVLTTRLHGLPTCTCTYTPRRRNNPYHDENTCLWAREILNYHTSGKPTWKQSDASRWNDPNVGYWEVAKLFMPSGCGKGNSCAETDATGLLNLLYWCSYYNTDATLVDELRDTRNAWAHAARQELNAAETTDAFTAIKKLLADPELTADPDATDVLNKITKLENEDLIDFENIENKARKHLEDFMLSMKDEIIEQVGQNTILATEIKDILLYCVRSGAERNSILYEILNKIEVMESREKKKSECRERMLDIIFEKTWSFTVLLLVTMTCIGRLIPSRARVLFLFLALMVTILDENMADLGCERQKYDDPFELKQFEFTEYLNRARENFVGRQWLFNKITTSLKNSHDESKGVLITGAPGFGKSALISNLICSKFSSSSIHDEILGYHLCIHSDKNTLSGAKFVRNLANMVAWRLQEYKDILRKDNFIQRILKVECLSDPVGCFEQGVLGPLRQLQLKFQTPKYIVIDALDECLNDKHEERTGTSVVDILRHKIKHFPNWIKVIATSRNVTNIRRKLRNLDVIELHPEDPRNLRDIERFLNSKLEKSFTSTFRRYVLSTREDVLSVSKLVQKSQGNFLYIKLILEYLQTRDLVSDKLYLPDSINSVYHDFFGRKYNSLEAFRAPRKIFEILVATKSPVTILELYDILFIENKNFDFEYELLPVLEELSMYLLYTQENSTISVYHNSLTEWLTSEDNKGGLFYVDEKKGYRALADYFLKIIHECFSKVNPKFIYDLATYIVIGENLKRHTDSFLKLDPKWITVKDNRTRFTALHLAAETENERVLGILLNFFKDVNIEDNKGRTPAFSAVTFGRLNNLRLLHEKGASLSHVTKSLLLDAQKNADEISGCKRQMCGYNLLHVAAQKGHKDIVEYLIQHGIDVSLSSATGSSAVQLAAESGHIEIMKLLLLHGAEADNTCLYYAAFYGQVEIVKFLLKKGIHDSCIFCNVIQIISNKKSFVQISDHLRHCNTALHAAAIGDYPDVIEALLSSKHNALYCVNRFGKEPFHEAVHHNNYRATKEFLRHGVDTIRTCKFSVINELSDDKFCFCGYTPLHLAARYGFAAITSLLLEHDSDYNATDCEGLQPIHVASCHGYGNVLSILIKNGADVNSKGPDDMTPIHYACKCKATDIFDKLFELGADGLALTADGKTPLHFLVKDYFLEESFYFVDPYAINPIDPVCFKSSEGEVVKSHMRKHAWFTASTKFLQSFTKTSDITLSDLNAVMGPLESFLSFDSVLPNTILHHISMILLGSDSHINVRLVVLSTPATIPVDIGLASYLQNQHRKLNQVSTSTGLPNLVKRGISKALIVTTASIKFKCPTLIAFIDHNLVYAVDVFLKLGMDVNCEELGLSPLLAYLRQGGRNMVKVLAKHDVTVDIKCGEYFQDSVFHLSAYHKLHYLQYLSIFEDPLKWEEYLKEDNALFDYLFDEFEEVPSKGQLKLRRVRDGPVTIAIKSNFRGYKIVDECLDNEGYTALHRAAQGGNVVAVKHFLNWGANPSLESPEEFDALVLSIWYAIKYRPYFNLFKPSRLTSLEIDFASLTAGVILKHLIESKPFDVGCDYNKETPTLLHLSATRGMWRFIDDLFVAKSHRNVIGLTANCATKDNITPMYVAKLHGGDDCDWDNPWCKVVGILSQYGGSMIHPDRVTEYFLILNFLFHDLPERFDMNDLTQEEIQRLSGDDKECKNSQNEGVNIMTGMSLGNYLVDDLRNMSNVYPVESKDAQFHSTTSQYRNVIWSLIDDESNFQTTKLDYYLFLSAQLIGMRWSLYFYRNIDHSIMRCVPHTMDPVSKYPAISNLNTQESLILEKELEEEDTPRADEVNEKIILTWFKPIPDMCSSTSTIDFETLDKISQKNRNLFNNQHKSFLKEIEKAKQTIRQQKVKIGIFDSVNMLFQKFESRMHCQMKDITYKYSRFKFLLHTMKFWSAQVKNLGMYPLISSFVSQRIEDILQSEYQKEMLPFIIKLAKLDPSVKYEYLKMFRFSAPPIAENFRKSDDRH